MVLSLLQGVVGNPFGNAVSGPAFGVLNELLGLMRGADGGIAKPSRYEVIFYHQWEIKQIYFLLS